VDLWMWSCGNPIANRLVELPSVLFALSLFLMVIGKWAMGQAAGEGLKLGFKKIIIIIELIYLD
jgi:hypothetical protein